MEWLGALQRASAKQQLQMRVSRRGVAGLSLQQLMAETGLARPAAERLVQPLILGQELFVVPGELLLGSQALEAAAKTVLGVLPQYVGGIKRSELRSRTSLRSEVLDFILQRLASAGKLVLSGELVSVVQRAASPDPALSAIERIYQQAGLSTPLTAEVAGKLHLNEAELRRFITLLLRQKILVQLGNADLFVHEEALARLRARISELHGQVLDVARFKQITGLSRKYAIPLLEYLDRQRITRKTGDERIVI
jgi:selenocysteine-specific elongation factor